MRPRGPCASPREPETEQSYAAEANAPAAGDVAKSITIRLVKEQRLKSELSREILRLGIGRGCVC